MKSNYIEHKLTHFLDQLPKKPAQSIRIQAFDKGRIKLDFSWGKEYQYYDLASLTKILLTTPLVMSAQKESSNFLNLKVSDILKWYKHSDSVKELMCHSAGNLWWHPFYKTIDVMRPVSHKKHQIKSIIRSLKKDATKKTIYSDIDFLLLGFLLEDYFESNLLELSDDLFDRLKLKNRLFFCPLTLRRNKLATSNTRRTSAFAPTETCPWRKKTLRAQVHDDNAWVMGGVAAHAGLFGSIDAVSEMALRFRDIYRGNVSYFSKKLFVPYTKQHKKDWGLGFMKPTPGASSAGKYFSKESFGHTGYTGTSLWIDPRKDILITMLSNRVYPTRKNIYFNSIRPILHDQIIKAMGVV